MKENDQEQNGIPFSEQVARHADDILTTRIALATLINMLPAEQRATFTATYRANIQDRFVDPLLFRPVPDEILARLTRSAADFERLLLESDQEARGVD